MPETILSPAEEELVHKTWSIVARDLKGNGANFYVHFFTRHPEYQALFTRFADIPLEKLPESKRFMAHALTVMTTINGFVDSLDDPEVLKELLVKTGMNHGKRGLKMRDFQNMKETMLSFLRNVLGGGADADANWSPEACDAWNKLLNIMVAFIGQGLPAHAV